jgi:hypothetical protein
MSLREKLLLPARQNIGDEDSFNLTEIVQPATAGSSKVVKQKNGENRIDGLKLAWFENYDDSFERDSTI